MNIVLIIDSTAYTLSEAGRALACEAHHDLGEPTITVADPQSDEGRAEWSEFVAGTLGDAAALDTLRNLGRVLNPAPVPLTADDGVIARLKRELEHAEARITSLAGEVNTARRALGMTNMVQP